MAFIMGAILGIIIGEFILNITADIVDTATTNVFI